MEQLKYDLHTHSIASDGVLSVNQLFDLAIEHNINYLALTDHDTINGSKSLFEYQKTQGHETSLNVISGAELTCMLGKQVLHIVALDIELDNPCLKDHLSRLSTLRYERAVRIASKLEKKKIPNLLPMIEAKVDSGLIARPHFARALCELGYVKSEAEAFKRYLGRGKVADVSVEWPELEDVLDIIKKAKGISVLAHPTKYNLTTSKLRRILEEFKLLGGEAVEVSYPGISIEQQRILSYEAEKHSLMVSAGSDLHDPQNKWTVLGRYPAISPNLPHVLDKILANKIESDI